MYTWVSRKLVPKTSSLLRSFGEKGCFCSENIVGVEYIVCTHWLNIVGAAAPTENWKLIGFGPLFLEEGSQIPNKNIN